MTRSILLLLIFCFEVQAQNFRVYAQREVAPAVYEWAEHYRKAQSLEWFGHELPRWNKTCDLHVNINRESTGFNVNLFDSGRVIERTIKISGPIEDVLYNVLPHEVTHVVLASKVGRPLPRWADEGAAILSESIGEQSKQKLRFRNVFSQNKLFPLKQLFSYKEYPNNTLVFYSQSYSVSSYLVNLRGKQEFLKFVQKGSFQGWEKAVNVYGFRSVEEMEAAWLKNISRGTRSVYENFSISGFPQEMD